MILTGVLWGIRKVIGYSLEPNYKHRMLDEVL